jgi:sortase A
MPKLLPALIGIILGLTTAGVLAWHGWVVGAPAFPESSIGYFDEALIEQAIDPQEETQVELTPAVADPHSLEIPKLNLNIPVINVGLDDDERMSAPEGFWEVGWFKYGPRPGEPGSSVLAGHLDSPTGPAVFYKLGQLTPGDLIYVNDVEGRQMTFEVIEVALYSDQTFPLELVFGRSDGVRLNLITCAGTYDTNARNYSDRLVVFTKLVEN